MSSVVAAVTIYAAGFVTAMVFVVVVGYFQQRKRGSR